MKASKDEQTVNLKLLKLLADVQKDDAHLHLSCHLFAAEIFTCLMMLTILNKSVLSGNYIKFPSISNKLPDRRDDCLQANDLHALYQERSIDYLFPLKFCGNDLMENSKSMASVAK